MCAKLIDKYLKKDGTVLDLGTGSGILAIIAKKLGSGITEAIDIDKLAVDVAQENCGINGCGDIECHTGELKDAKRNDYDVIVANIIADIIAAIAKDIPERLADGGLFICSGIVNTKAPRVEKALEDSGLIKIAAEEDNDWRAYVYRKP
jgi:ribosomal protein L11 methyltransferase